jgi:hypothetical protein
MNRVSSSVLTHYAVVRLGAIRSTARIYDLGSHAELTEEQAKTIWENYLAHVPLGVRADFSTS